MTNPMIRIHDVETNEIIDREMNAAELAQHKIDVAASKVKADEAAAKETAKASALAKLAALGLTEDEVNGLIS